MKIKDEFSGTLTLTENSTKELFRVLKEQDEKFINDVLDGKYGFTLKSTDGRSVKLIPADKLQGSGQSLMKDDTIEDLIKRSDALEVVYRYCPDDDGSCSCADRDLREMLNDMEDIPTADRPQGEWIEVDDVSISCRCSVCGWEAHLYEDDVYGMPYCPNCGARMRPKLQGTHFDSIIIDECAMKGAADDEI